MTSKSRQKRRQTHLFSVEYMTAKEYLAAYYRGFE